MVRPTLINMNPVELKYYAFIISLNKVVMPDLQKYVFQKNPKKQRK